MLAGSSSLRMGVERLSLPQRYSRTEDGTYHFDAAPFLSNAFLTGAQLKRATLGKPKIGLKLSCSQATVFGSVVAQSGESASSPCDRSLTQVWASEDSYAPLGYPLPNTLTASPSPSSPSPVPPNPGSAKHHSSSIRSRVTFATIEAALTMGKRASAFEVTVKLMVGKKEESLAW